MAQLPSNQDGIRTALAQLQSDLGLTWNGVLIPNKIVQDDDADPAIDSYPIFLIANDNEGTRERKIAFAGASSGTPHWVPYKYRITMVAEGHLNNLGGLGDYPNWRAKITNALEDPQCLVPYGITSIGGIKITDDPVINKSQFKEGYNISGVVVEVTTLEG